jgi:Pyridoxamine 5'-phosphate oxidase
VVAPWIELPVSSPGVFYPTPGGRTPVASPGMARWSDVEAEAPELAARAKARFDAHVHKTIATLRQDGSPRISGIEVSFVDGDLWTGSMWQAVKALDLQRDPRYALHSGSDDPPGWTGDAKVAGVAEEVTDPERKAAIVGGDAPVDESHLFRLDLTELVVVRLGEPGDHIVVEAWHAGRGVTRRERR